MRHGLSSRLKPPLIGILLAALLMLGGVAPAAVSAQASLPEGGTGPKVVSPGVTYQKISQRKPQRVFHLLRIAPDSPADIDVSMSNPNMPGYNLPSRIITQDGGVAGVNGDFGLVPGRPAHAMMIDGELIQTSNLGGEGRVMALTGNGRAWIDKPSTRIEGVSVHGPIDIAQWNAGPPRLTKIAGYSPRGGTVEQPPPDACSARLTPTDSRHLSADRRATEQSFLVDAVRCGTAAMALEGGVVISAKTAGAGADAVNALVVGDSMTVQWSLGGRQVVDAMGGSAQLLQEGEIVVESCTQYLCLRHPRTAVGITATGEILIVVIDGRSLRSGGATIVGLAKLMKSIGAVEALNLDGGGSSTMVVNGQVMNNPSDGRERSVTSALVILPDADPNDPF